MLQFFSMHSSKIKTPFLTVLFLCSSLHSANIWSRPLSENEKAKCLDAASLLIYYKLQGVVETKWIERRYETEAQTKELPLPSAVDCTLAQSYYDMEVESKKKYCTTSDTSSITTAVEFFNELNFTDESTEDQVIAGMEKQLAKQVRDNCPRQYQSIRHAASGMIDKSFEEACYVVVNRIIKDYSTNEYKPNNNCK